MADLHTRGFSVDMASDGRKAAEAISRRHYDVVVSGIALAAVNGIALTRWARRRPHRPRMILLTDSREWKVFLKACEAGAARILHEPVNPWKVVSVVEKVVRRENDGAWESRRTPKSPA